MIPIRGHVFDDLYACSGLVLSATRPVPGLVPLDLPDGEPDVRIWMNDPAPWSREIDRKPSDVRYQSEEREGAKPRLVVREFTDGTYFHFVYGDGTEFFIDREGTRVWATWDEESATIEDTTTYLLGPIVGFVLRLRGRVPLHASAVVVEGTAIAFVGPAHSGKSTTAAAFAMEGYPVVSDDVVLLEETETGFVVYPGYPLLRLWPRSVEMLFGAPDALPLLTPNWDKRYLALSGGAGRLADAPTPLAAIYLFGRRTPSLDSPVIEPEPVKHRLVVLTANSYVNYLLDREMRAREFRVLGQLVRQVPMRRIRRPAAPEGLGAVVRAVLEDVEGRATGPDGRVV